MNARLTAEQQTEAKNLCQALRSIAAPVGVLHSFWEIITDLECLQNGQPTLLQMSADDYLAFARSSLDEHHRKLHS